MEYNVRLEQLRSRPLAVVCCRAGLQELSKVVPDACGTVWGVVRTQQVPGQGGMSRSTWTIRSTWKWASS
jgi:hypothetical protein